MVASADIAGLIASAAPGIVTCTSPISVEPLAACYGAMEGESREYLSFGFHGLEASEEGFAQLLAPELEGIPHAVPTADSYGPGILLIGGIQCFSSKPDEDPCTAEWTKIIYTAIEPERGRRVYCFEVVHTVTSWALRGFSCSVPPLDNLYSFETPAIAKDGTEGTFTSYPWTPSLQGKP